MQTITLDLTPQTAEVTRVVAGVRDDQLSGPTPCPEMTVAALLDHLMGLTEAFRLAAQKVPQHAAPSAAAGSLDDDWRARLPERLAALAAAWREPSAWEGTAVAGGVEMPAHQLAHVALDEVLVHGWDLAVATGQAYWGDTASAQACLDFVGDRSGDPADEPEGLFGPVVPVPDGAPVLDRLLGRTGRDPGWTPR